MSATLDASVTAMAQDLAAILARYRGYREDRADQARIPFLPAQKMTQFEISPVQPWWIESLRNANRDPIHYALRASARELGWRAYAIGGRTLMGKLFDLAVRGSTSHETLRSWWDGIGNPDQRDQWWA
jgi:hypothetical protein